MCRSVLALLIALGMVAPAAAQQVLVETRFISVNDDFFERIGIDFSVAVTSHVDYLFKPQGDWRGLADHGVGTRITYKSPFVASGDGTRVLYGLAGFQHQTWDSNRVNLNTPTDNFVPDGSLNSFGGEVGGGIELGSFSGMGDFGGSSDGLLGFAILSDIESFMFMEAACGGGYTGQNVVQAPFNPLLPIIPIGVGVPRENAGYVNGRISAGLGLTGPNGGTLALVLTQQWQGSDLLFGNGSVGSSTAIGLQASVPFPRRQSDRLTTAGTWTFQDGREDSYRLDDYSSFRTLAP